jgi:hypothetical protein
VATTDPHPPEAPPTRVAKPKRGSETAMDMIRSLGLIAVIVAVTLIFVPGLVHPSKKDKLQALDYSNYLEGFQSLTKLTPLAPAPVPTGWHANSATLTGPRQAEHLRIGFVTPDEQYVGLVQSIGTPAVVIRTLLGKSAVTPSGHVTIAGVPWEERTSSAHEVALTHVFAPQTGAASTGVITVIVTGSATMQQLQAFAATLK